MKPALRLLPWLGLAALTGCSMDDDLGDCTSGTSALQVTVSARQEGDLNARATEGGQDGEFMHDLCVLFVQGNTVKLKLQPDLSGDAGAREGNLQAWTSGEQKGLEAGTYTVYAFANISDHYGKWNVGTELSGDALPEEIVLTDPAGELNSGTRQYIPMAAKKEEVTITAATRSVSIGLDRLVAKVRMTVGTTSQEPVTVKNVTFSGYADKVSLIPGASISSTLLRDKMYEYTEEFQISANQDMDIPDFYVNETQEGDPFTISVTTTENQGVTYLATTKLNNLPRNSIYPLTLNLNQSELNITAEVYLVAIGAAVEDCKVELVEGQQDTYRLRIPAGGLFKMQLNNKNGITYANGCSWENDPANKYIALTTSGNTEAGGVPSVTGTTVWGYSSASNIYDEYPIYLTAKWTDGTNNFTRKYTILIATEDMFNFDYVETNTNANMASPLYLNKEYLNMFIKK